jgi:hypothetical protein
LAYVPYFWSIKGRIHILALVIYGENNMERGESSQPNSTQRRLIEMMEQQIETVERLLANLQVSDRDHIKKVSIQQDETQIVKRCLD